MRWLGARASVNAPPPPFVLSLSKGVLRANGSPGARASTRSARTVRGRVQAFLLLLLCLAGLARLAEGAVIPAKAALAQLLLERAFARSVATHRPVRPWPWADMAPVARLSVPRLGVARVVLDAGSGQAMAFGPTLLPAAAPIGQGASVIAAHRDTHFAFLRDVRRGDAIDLATIDGRVRRYRVTGARVVRWDGFALPRDADELDLATCWPFGALAHGPWRYVVRAAPA